MTEETKLLPCPFCTKDLAVLQTSEYRDGYEVVCDASGYENDKNRGCGASTGWNETEESAVAAWNRRASQWQPIETAPKDGSIFILLDNPNSIAIFATWHDGEYRERNSMTFIEIECFTHWMPLPQPPTEE